MKNMTSEKQELLLNLYDAFHWREFEKILSMMQPDVKWANGMEGGFVYGRDAVREYWLKQLLEKTVQQIFTFDSSLISLFEISGTEPLHLTGNANKQLNSRGCR